MAKTGMVLVVVATLALPGTVGAIGRADVGAGVGMPEWAAGPRPETPVAATHEGSVGQALGGGVGMPEHIRERLMAHETLGAAVGMPDSIRERLTAQGALGTAAGMPEPIRERLMSHETLGVAVGMPEQVRARLMALAGQP